MVSGRKAKEARRTEERDALARSALHAERERLTTLLKGFDGRFETLSRLVDQEPDALMPVLRARATLRNIANAERDDLLPDAGWRAGYALFAADVALETVSGCWYRTETPGDINDRWLRELRGGLDVFARICWCLRFGYTFAAVAASRLYLERWTFNVASSHNISSVEGEDDAAYIDRIWSTYEADGDSLGAGTKWSQLSELLHGRAITLGAGSVRLPASDSPIARFKLHKLVVETAEIALRQVRGAIDTVLGQADASHRFHAYLQARTEHFPRPTARPDFLNVFHEPLSYDFVHGETARTTLGWGESYRRIVRNNAGEKLLIPPPSWMALEERWVRFIHDARFFFERERSQLPDSFDPDQVEGTLVMYQAISEMAEMVAGRLSNEKQGDALRAAAAALESSWVLWLHDVDDSMLAMRAVLELTARCRVHRTKPPKAQKLEDDGRKASPHRWIEEAGWRRQSSFTRALGEFAHFTERSRHASSRALLTSIQRGGVEGFEAYTARGNALDEVARMLAHETAAVLADTDAPLAERFRASVLHETEDESERALSEWLDKALTYRAYDFGDADYVASAESDSAVPSDDSADPA